MPDPNVILQWLQSMGFLAGIQLYVGSWLKRQPNFQNRIIPWITLLLAIVGYSLTPTAAVAADAIAAVGAPATVSGALGLGLLTVVHTLLVTGVHSFSKNSLIPILRDGLRVAALAFLRKADK